MQDAVVEKLAAWLRPHGDPHGDQIAVLHGNPRQVGLQAVEPVVLFSPTI